MILTQILSDLEYTCAHPSYLDGTLDAFPIDDIVYDSRKAAPGTLFVCLIGAVSDGHSYAPSAYERGCRAFLVQRKLELPDDAVQILVKDTRAALALASAAFFGYPARSLLIIGITGTKGKTTTASLTADILNAGGIPTAYIGTTGISYLGKHFPTVNTTPESYELHKAFAGMAADGVSAVVMEVSSQAVYMRRILGIHFHIGVFTNLSPDHIGGVEHPTFEHYMACKAELFRQCRCGIFNADDPHCTEMMRAAPAIRITYGMEGAQMRDIMASGCEAWKSGNLFGEKFLCRTALGEEPITLRMPGRFNIYNAMAAIAVAVRMQIPMEIIRNTLASATVKGRFELIDALPDVVTVIDYAHNGASMKAALETLRRYQTGRLTVLFGSVGGKSEMRRGELREICASLADFCIITSDNPNFESPEAIIRDIEEKVAASSCPYVTFVDRQEAIRYAINRALPGDCILFAGKGHEDYQLIEGEYRHFDEREEIAAAALARTAYHDKR